MDVTIGSSPWETAAWMATVFNSALILIAIWQLYQNRQTSAAQLLLSLNDQWDNPEMVDARFNLRRRMEAFRGEIHAALTRANAGVPVSHELVSAKLPDRFADHLTSLRSSTDAADRKEYQGLINVFGFFETTGLMVKRGYVSRTLILDLFSGPAIDAHQCMRAWAERVEQEPGMRPGFFANARWLGDLAARAG